MNVRETARHIASLGSGKDSVLAHINPEEAALLAKLGGGSVNPHTGLPQFGFWSNLGGALTGGGIGGAKELFKNPRKWLGDRVENPATKVIGPIALDFIPGYGPLLSAGATALYKGHDERHNGPSKEYGQSAIAGVGSYLAGESASNSTYGSGGAGGYMGVLSKLLGGITGGGSSSGSSGGTATTSPPAAPSTATAASDVGSAGGGNNAYLATQMQELKQQLQQSYADAGQADSPELQQSLQDLDAWHMAQSQAAQPQQAAQPKAVTS